MRPKGSRRRIESKGQARCSRSARWSTQETTSSRSRAIRNGGLTYLAQLACPTVRFPEEYESSARKSSLQNAIGAQAFGHLDAQGLQDAFLLDARAGHATEDESSAV